MNDISGTRPGVLSVGIRALSWLWQQPRVWLQAIKAEMAGSEGVRVALEPNVVPYHIEPHIEHWVLWYHPESTSGKADLCADQFVPHLRRFLPSLRAEEEVLCFQNLP